jgi:DNA invertase Pin-like site-specific DNA recombinase
MVLKGRQARGERHGGRRLSEADVRALRAEAAAGQSASALAVRFGIGATHVRRIIRRQEWAHL